jgi:Fe-Mn family superoxide dismutase
MLPAAAAAAAPALLDLGHGPRPPFVLPPLPYPASALAPVISARTVQFHYHRHHAGYLAALNRALADQPPGPRTLVDVIRESAGQPGRTGRFNNAAQVWNHSFYWRCLGPRGGGQPEGPLAAAIQRDFGNFASLREQLLAAARAQFGSGWVWLCAEGGRLTVRRTANAETPIREPGVMPLLTLDVWEHAYYLDYQHRRADHVAQLIDRLLNWPWAAGLFEAHLAMGGRPPVPVPSPPAPAALPPLAALPPAGETRASMLARLARRR